MSPYRLALLLPVAAAILALSACPNPLTDLTVSQLSDKASPVITFSSPAEGSAYTQTVLVQGTAAEAGRIKELTWTVTGTLGKLASGTIEPATMGANGAFSFQFGTLDFSGPLAVTVQAVDWNDNTGAATRTLVSPGSSLSSFTVDPGNASVLLDWEPVPGASHTLYYTTNGSLPAQGYGLERSIGSPPQSLTGLSNGGLHVFLLKATAAGRDYWSGYVKAIPLADSTLAPTARGLFGAVRLEWKPILGTGEFEVLRSTSRETGFSNISGTLAGSSFTDTDALPGVRYFYKVRPALAGSDSSAPVAGESVAFPLDTERRTGYLYPPGGQLMDVAISGTWAFAASYNSGLQVFDVTDPSRPVYVTGLATGADHAMGIALGSAGTVAYVTAGNFVYSFDVSSPAAPQLLAKSVSVGAQAWGITVRGADVFVAASSAGAIKFANGNLSTIAGTFNTSGAGGGSAYGIAADANYVYIAAESRAFVVNPPALTLAGSMNASRAMGIAVATRGPTTYAYIADETGSGLRIFDVTNPASIGTLGTLTLTGMSPRGVAVSGSSVALAGYISVGGAALQVANVTDPSAPRLAFSVMLPTLANRVTVSGDYAYVAEGLGLQVANIANPSGPVAQSSPPVLTTAYALAVDGDIAVVTSLSTGVQVYSLAVPGSPSQWGLGLLHLQRHTAWLCDGRTRISPNPEGSKSWTSLLPFLPRRRIRSAPRL